MKGKVREKMARGKRKRKEKKEKKREMRWWPMVRGMRGERGSWWVGWGVGREWNEKRKIKINKNKIEYNIIK